MFFAIMIIGLLPILGMFIDILKNEIYEWILVIPFYVILYIFILYQAEILFPL